MKTLQTRHMTSALLRMHIILQKKFRSQQFLSKSFAKSDTMGM